MSEDGFVSRYFSAQDGLRLHYRDYGDPLSPGTPILCLAGLARNSIDFHEFALRHADRHRVLAIDLRGRGLSAYDPDYRNYHPLTYALDVTHLLMLTHCHRVVMVGTSLGGILAMALATIMPACLAGAVLNDIGPDVDDRGIERITGYVGKPVDEMTMEQAAAQLAEQFANAYPDYTEADWLADAKRTYLVKENGRIALNYDRAINKALSEQSVERPDLWPYFRCLRHAPLLALRGERSDILSAETFERMQREHDDITALTVANRGHTPTLSEPEVVAALDQFLHRFESSHA